MDRRYIDRIYLNQPVPADSYLASLPAVRALGGRDHPLTFPAPVTFLVGENGTGKSTLLEAIAVACGLDVYKRQGLWPPRTVEVSRDDIHPADPAGPHLLQRRRGGFHR